MEWIERPTSAGESWPADDLRIRPLPIGVGVRTVDGAQTAGVLDEVTADTIELDTDAGPLTIDVRHIAAYAILEDVG
jgi:hypothetical protein